MGATTLLPSGGEEEPEDAKRRGGATVDKLGSLRKSVVAPLLMDETRAISHYETSAVYEALDEALGEKRGSNIALHASW